MENPVFKKSGPVIFIGFLFLFSISAFGEVPHLKLATTTSTENSGLLNYLLPVFESSNKIKVDVIAVGTGQSLKLGESGDADVVLVHARSAEDQFISNGFGTNRKDVMHNDFIILGPTNDVLNLRQSSNVIKAFLKLSNDKIEFVSRGDESGTHKKEKEIWKKTGITPSGKWYLESGKGMEEAILMAFNRNAYVLSDRATYLAIKSKVDLKIVFENDPLLMNPYGIIAVNPVKRVEVTKGNISEKEAWEKYQLAMKLVNWLVSPEGQALIKNYCINGQVLFYPDAMNK